MTDLRPAVNTHTLVIDGIIALGVFLFSLLGGQSVLVAIVQGLLFALPVGFRRVDPDIATLAVIPAFILQLFLTDTPMPGDIAAPIMLYTVAAYGRPRWTQAWLIFGLLCGGVAGFYWTRSVYDASVWPFTFVIITGGCAAFVAAAWFMGSLRRSRLAGQQANEDRAAALQREQVQAVQLAATTERQRIAREMHDIVAHSLSIIVVQADGARYVATEAPGDPEARLAQAATAIETIAATARSALGETRRLVGVLHDDQGAELTPTEGLADIAGLVQNLTMAGRNAWLMIEGDPASHPPLGAVAELAAYRVVQESITNVLKHAGPAASTWVLLQHRPEGLTVCVRDNGPGSTGGDGRGHGLSGLSARVGSLGGTLFAHTMPGGGFEVAAHLPARSQEDPHDPAAARR